MDKDTCQTCCPEFNPWDPHCERREREIHFLYCPLISMHVRVPMASRHAHRHIHMCTCMHKYSDRHTHTHVHMLTHTLRLTHIHTQQIDVIFLKKNWAEYQYPERLLPGLWIQCDQLPYTPASMSSTRPRRPLGQ